MSLVDFSDEELVEIASLIFFGMDLDFKQFSFLQLRGPTCQSDIERFEELSRVRYSILVKVSQAVSEERREELKALLKTADEIMLTIGRVLE